MIQPKLSGLKAILLNFSTIEQSVSTIWSKLHPSYWRNKSLKANKNRNFPNTEMKIPKMKIPKNS